jgi:UDP-N-acetylmuramoylalanine--D-glutamate ligase
MVESTPASPHLILGLGQTGLSCARYFKRHNAPFIVFDTRQNPPQRETFLQEFPDVPLYLGHLPDSILPTLKSLVVSPGVDRTAPWFTKIISATQLTPYGDIELFAQQAKAPIIAITGTNAKGTVTTLVGHFLTAAGYNVIVGGNIGQPVLDQLIHPCPDFYVLEISSFQLETTVSLRAHVATILNISPDHLDRHPSLQAYQQAKQRIYQNCQIAVWNQTDSATYPQAANVEKSAAIRSFGFAADEQDIQAFGLHTFENQRYLTHGKKPLLAVDTLYIKGQHNWLNALAALTIGTAVGISVTTMCDALRTFKGLTHRCQWIREIKGVAWYNDSKATNVGATFAALQGLGSSITGKIVLIAGGLGKNADFSLLRDSVSRYVKTAILIGQDGPQLKKALETCTVLQSAADLRTAMSLAKQNAKPGDIVLLSPACASWDMFKNYEERGDQFTQIVEEFSNNAD